MEGNIISILDKKTRSLSTNSQLETSSSDNQQDNIIDDCKTFDEKVRKILFSEGDFNESNIKIKTKYVTNEKNELIIFLNYVKSTKVNPYNIDIIFSIGLIEEYKDNIIKYKTPI